MKNTDNHKKINIHWASIICLFLVITGVIQFVAINNRRSLNTILVIIAFTLLGYVSRRILPTDTIIRQFRWLGSDDYCTSTPISKTDKIYLYIAMFLLIINSILNMFFSQIILSVS